MVTCLCDAIYGEVAISTVQVLEKLGCKVHFPKNQTCCGQPPFNSGDWENSKLAANHCISEFQKQDLPVVVPSASCAAMVREGYKMMGLGSPLVIYELSEFIADKCQLDSVKTWKSYPHKVAFHQACHGRSIGLKDQQETLLRKVPNIQLVAFEQAEQCCGFGGAFCVTHGALSEGIGLEKLKNIKESGANEIVTGDMGCAVHLEGLIKKHQMNLRIRHFSEILAEVLI